ncbi:MAG: Hint domain-containing protein [Phycisphaerales bacterium]|nr:hypothetical protein [Planctomycetota bacterium]
MVRLLILVLRLFVSASEIADAMHDPELLGKPFATQAPLAAHPDSAQVIEPSLWRRIELEARNASGGRVTASLLRPIEWIDAAGAKAGEDLSIDFHGLNLAAPVCVRSIEACPPVKPPSPGSEAVTGAFRTEGVAIVRVKLFGDDKPIGVTTGHPFFVHDTGEWVPAGELKPGQRVRTLDGYASVVSVEDRGETATVYNLEVRRSHTYYAGALRAWVHNPCKLTSGIGRNSRLVKEAEFAAVREQQALDALVGRLREGNWRAGGGHQLFGEIWEARQIGGSGARVYFRRIGENGIEIVAKSVKANQEAVIAVLKKLYGG